MTITEKLRNMRKERKLSMKKLAKESGVSYNTIVTLERKNKQSETIRLNTIYNLCDFYGVSLSEFFSDVTLRNTTKD